MLDFLRGLFGTDFMPHLYCLRGELAVLWLHVLSDLAIAVCYFAIPFVLLRVVLKRKEVLFRRVATLFVLFITACGTTHLLGVWVIWSPMYRLEGVVKAATALFSIGTAVVLLRLRKQIEQLPSFAELEKEVMERREAEESSRDKEERFRSFVEGVQDYAMFMINPEGLVQTWNLGAERIKGYTAEEIVGKHFSRFYTHEDRERKRPEEAIKVAEETGRYEIEGWRVRKDGSKFWASTVLRPRYGAGGELRGFSKITRDLTQSRAMEAKYQTLLDSAPDAIVMYGKPGRVVYLNQKAEEMFGYSRTELLGKPVEILIPERLREDQAKNREGIFDLPKSAQMGVASEYLCVHRDGSEFAVEASVRPLETPDGLVALAAVRDVTERNKAERRFRDLLESAPDAMVITDSQGRIELTNLQAERLFGYPRGELIGQSVEILIPPDLRAGYGKDIQEFSPGGLQRKTGTGEELRARRKDGTEFPVEISFSPLEGPHGTSLTAAIRDLTERKKSDARFRALLESAPDAMVIVNAEGLIQLANFQSERLFGYSGSELIGQSVDILVPERLRGGHGGHRNQFFADPKPREMGAGLDLMAIRKDGTEFPVEISLSPLEGPDGTSVTAAIRDMTERRRAAAQLAEKMTELRHSNDALEQFAHIASHDLQEPLRMVASYTQLLSRRYRGKLDSDADEFIAYAVDGTQRMKRLIEDLLLYSRAGKGSPPVRKFPSEEALQEALSNLHATIGESHARVTYDPLPEVAAADSQLVQIFQNLIGNAIKYRGEATPQIHISERRTELEWIFSVADNGIGIEPRFYERVFEIFQRLHGRGEYEGTGIGLAICKRILQQQGGRIWVESEAGKGSVFYFALPVR